MNRSAFVISEGETFFFWWFSLVLSVTHQRTVKIGQAPFLANEYDHRILSATGNLSILGRSVGVVCHASAHCEDESATIFGK